MFTMRTWIHLALLALALTPITTGDYTAPQPGPPKEEKKEPATTLPSSYPSTEGGYYYYPDDQSYNGYGTEGSSDYYYGEVSEVPLDYHHIELELAQPGVDYYPEGQDHPAEPAQPSPKPAPPPPQPSYDYKLAPPAPIPPPPQHDYQPAPAPKPAPPSPPTYEYKPAPQPKPAPPSPPKYDYQPAPVAKPAPASPPPYDYQPAPPPKPALPSPPHYDYHPAPVYAPPPPPPEPKKEQKKKEEPKVEPKKAVEMDYETKQKIYKADPFNYYEHDYLKPQHPKYWVKVSDYEPPKMKNPLNHDEKENLLKFTKDRIKTYLKLKDMVPIFKDWEEQENYEIGTFVDKLALITLACIFLAAIGTILPLWGFAVAQPPAGRAFGGSRLSMMLEKARESMPTPPEGVDRLARTVAAAVAAHEECAPRFVCEVGNAVNTLPAPISRFARVATRVAKTMKPDLGDLLNAFESGSCYKFKCGNLSTTPPERPTRRNRVRQGTRA